MIGKYLSQYRENCREAASQLESVMERIGVEPGFSGVSSAVDGGVVVKKYAGFDMIFYRAVGVVFGESVTYHPEKFPPLEFRMNDVGNSSRWASILRQTEEVRRMIEIVEEHSPDLPLLDGSLRPHPSMKTERFADDYREMEKLFSSLWKMKAVGIIKDPRSSSLTKHFLGVEMRDSSVINEFLPPNSRTPVFRTGEIRWFYLKIGNDFPVKVEFTKGNPDDISSGIISLSRGYQNLPLPLIEADHVVKIRENEIKLLESRYLYDPTLKRRRDRAG